MESNNISAEEKWKLNSYSYQIADTGDYDGHWEITNGKISICTQDDFEECLEDIVKVLNASGIDFYLSEDIEYENSLLKEEIKQLKCPHTNIDYSVSNDLPFKYYQCTDCKKLLTAEEYALLNNNSDKKIVLPNSQTDPNHPMYDPDK